MMSLSNSLQDGEQMSGLFDNMPSAYFSTWTSIIAAERGLAGAIMGSN